MTYVEIISQMMLFEFEELEGFKLGYLFGL
jgi:hypothetical protein